MAPENPNFFWPAGPTGYPWASAQSVVRDCTRVDDAFPPISERFIRAVPTGEPVGAARSLPEGLCWCGHRAGRAAFEGGGITGSSRRRHQLSLAPHAEEAGLKRPGRQKGRISAAGPSAMHRNHPFSQGESTYRVLALWSKSEADILNPIGPYIIHSR